MKLGKNGVRYVRYVPKTIPRGLRLVHNFPPGDPDRPLGAGGFRAFWKRADDAKAKGYFLCRCGWAPHLKRHYTTHRDRIDIIAHVLGVSRVAAAKGGLAAEESRSRTKRSRR
jgi:hypothetical protein